MTVKSIGSHPTTMAPRFEVNWEPFGKKTFIVGYTMMEDALMIPETADGIIHLAYEEEIYRHNKLIDRKTKINKIIGNEPK